jgi:hypothetical protein
MVPFRATLYADAGSVWLVSHESPVVSFAMAIDDLQGLRVKPAVLGLVGTRVLFVLNGGGVLGVEFATRASCAGVRGQLANAGATLADESAHV